MAEVELTKGVDLNSALRRAVDEAYAKCDTIVEPLKRAMTAEEYAALDRYLGERIADAERSTTNADAYARFMPTETNMIVRVRLSTHVQSISTIGGSRSAVDLVMSNYWGPKRPGGDAFFDNFFGNSFSRSSQKASGDGTTTVRRSSSSSP